MKYDFIYNTDIWILKRKISEVFIHKYETIKWKVFTIFFSKKSCIRKYIIAMSNEALACSENFHFVSSQNVFDFKDLPPDRVKSQRIQATHRS